MKYDIRICGASRNNKTMHSQTEINKINILIILLFENIIITILQYQTLAKIKDIIFIQLKYQ